MSVKVKGTIRDLISKQLYDVDLDVLEDGESPVSLEDLGYNIQKRIRTYLNEMGCEISEARGIWTVKTPDGVVWDFTIPQVVGEKR